MTWSVRISDKEGSFRPVDGVDKYSVCQDCKHFSGDWAHPNCYLPLITTGLGQMLTGIDHGADGHVAPGEAIMKCSGFEQKEA
jgi:hypothetical protein